MSAEENPACAGVSEPAADRTVDSAPTELKLTLGSPIDAPAGVQSARAGGRKRPGFALKPLVVKNSTHSAPKSAPHRTTERDAWWKQTYKLPSEATLGAHAAAPASSQSSLPAFALPTGHDVNPDTAWIEVSGPVSAELPALAGGPTLGRAFSCGSEPEHGTSKRARKLNPFAAKAGPLFHYAVPVVNGRGPSSEASYLVEPCVAGDRQQSFYGLIHGHGGGEAAKYCFEHYLDHALGLPWFHERPGDGFRVSFIAADAGFRATDAAGDAPHDGASLLCCFMHGRHGVVAHVGSSRAILLKRDGTWSPLTCDHTPERDADRLRLQAGETGYKHVKSSFTYARSIGDAGERLITPHPDVMEFDVVDGVDDLLIMASEGPCPCVIAFHPLCRA